MTTLKEKSSTSKKTNLKTIKKETKNTGPKDISKENKEKKTNKPTIKKINKKNKTNTTKKTIKKSNQTGGSDVCSRDLNDLLTGNPLVMTGKDTDFSGDLNKMGKEFADDVMGSFKGVKDGWEGNPGMPPKLPEGCTIL